VPSILHALSEKKKESSHLPIAQQGKTLSPHFNMKIDLQRDEVTWPKLYSW
jgi:hypothetical protein